jgi:hypothetical protein
MLSANSDVLLHLVVSGLFSGFGWLAFGRVFGIGARFGVYEILTAYCKGKVFFLNLLLVLLCDLLSFHTHTHILELVI